jgi:hypothetical protein
MHAQHAKDVRTALGNEHASVVARKQPRETLSHAVRL